MSSPRRADCSFLHSACVAVGVRRHAVPERAHHGDDLHHHPLCPGHYFTNPPRYPEPMAIAAPRPATATVFFMCVLCFFITCGVRMPGREPTAAGSLDWPDRAGIPGWTSSRPSRRQCGRNCRRDMSGRRSSRTTRIRHRRQGSSRAPETPGRGQRCPRSRRSPPLRRRPRGPPW
jgi:hypothetical protein